MLDETRARQSRRPRTPSHASRTPPPGSRPCRARPAVQPRASGRPRRDHWNGTPQPLAVSRPALVLGRNSWDRPCSSIVDTASSTLFNALTWRFQGAVSKRRRTSWFGARVSSGTESEHHANGDRRLPPWTYGLTPGGLIEAVIADSESDPAVATTGFTAKGISVKAGCPLGSPFSRGRRDELITKRLGADRSDDDRCGLGNR